MLYATCPLLSGGGPPGSVKAAIRCRVARSHRYVVPFESEVASSVPSGLNATAVTPVSPWPYGPTRGSARTPIRCPVAASHRNVLPFA